MATVIDEVRAAIGAAQEWDGCFDEAANYSSSNRSDEAEAARRSAAVSKQDAAIAAEYGDEALAHAEVGAWPEAMRCIVAAVGVEREYGDTPAWGPAARAVFAAWCEVDEDAARAWADDHEAEAAQCKLDH